MEDNFLTKLVREPTKGEVLQNLLLGNREELVDMWWLEAVWGTVTMK